MLTGYLDLLKDIIKDLYDIKDHKKQNDDVLINLSKLAKKIDEDLQKVSNNTGFENIFIRNLKQSLEGTSSIIQKISFNASLESLSFNLLISSLDMHLEILEDILPRGKPKWSANDPSETTPLVVGIDAREVEVY